MIDIQDVLIDISEDASNSLGFKTNGLLLSGIEFPAAMTGSNITFDYSIDNTNWVDVVETDGTEVTYVVSVGNIQRLDPSGWAFAGEGWLRITSDGTEAADRTLKVYTRHS